MPLFFKQLFAEMKSFNKMECKISYVFVLSLLYFLRSRKATLPMTKLLKGHQFSSRLAL